MSVFRISMGSDSGLAYFGLQFAAGPQWFDDPVVTEAPILDLDTAATSIHRSVTFDGTAPVAFSDGDQNIVGADGGVSHLIIRFPAIAVEDGEIGIHGAISGSAISLDFADDDPVSDVVLNGVTYAVEASVTAENEKRLTFSPDTGDTFAQSDAEDLLDAFRFDSATDTVPGTRTFGVSVIDGVFQSRIAELTIFAVINAEANGSEINVDQGVRIAGEEESLVQVQLRDEEGNAILQAGVDIQFNTTLGQLNGGAGPITVQSNGDGVAEVHLSSTSAGTATVTAAVDIDGIFEDVSRGGPGNNGTVTVIFAAGAANAGQSGVTVSPASIVADGASTSLVTISLVDTHGNTLTAGGDDVFLTTDLGSLGSISDEADGTYTARLTSGTTPGDATITAYLGSDDDGTLIGTTTVTFTPAKATTDDTTVTASPLSIIADGAAESTITVQLKNSSGDETNVLGGVALTVETSAGTLLGTLQDNGNGNYTQQLRSSTVAQNAFVTAYLDDDPVEDTVTVAFIPGPIDGGGGTGTGNGTAISVDENERIAGVETSTVTVQLRDAYGNAVPEADVNVRFSTTLGQLDGSASTVTVTTDANGVAQVTLSSTATGDANVTAAVEIGGDFVDVINGGTDGVVTVSFLAGTPAQLAFAQQPTDQAAGESLSPALTVRIEDAHGNLTASTAEVTLALTLPGAAILGGSATAEAVAGLATFDDLSIALVGTYSLTASTSGLADTDSIAFDITAAAPAAAVLTGPSTVVAGEETAAFTLTIVDAFGNPSAVDEGTVFNLSTTSRGLVQFAPTSPVTVRQDESSVTFTYVDSEAGAQTITAEWDAENEGPDLGAGEQGVIVLSDAISAAVTGSRLSGSNLTPVADGVQAAAFTVQLRDVFGNAVHAADVEVQFNTTFGALADVIVNTDSTGRAATTLRSTATGTALVSASIADPDLGPVSNGSPVQVEFRAGPATGIRFVTPERVVSPEEFSEDLRVQLMDEHGNAATSNGTTEIALASDPAGLRFRATAGDETVTTVAIGNGESTASFSTTGSIGGVYTLTADASSLKPANQRFTVDNASPTVNAEDLPDALEEDGDGGFTFRANDSETVSLDLGAAFADDDGDLLRFSATGVPDDLTIDRSTGLISGTLGSSASSGGPAGDGRYETIVTIEDGRGGIITFSFTFVVLNLPPEANNASFTVEPGKTLSAAVTDRVRSPDGDALTFDIAQEPENGTLAMSSSGRFDYTSRAGFEGPDGFIFRVTDADGDSATGTVSIDVNSPPDFDLDDTNIIPSDDGPNYAEFFVEEEVLAITTIRGTDPESDSLTYRIDGGADAARFTLDEATGELRFRSPVLYDPDGSNAYEVDLKISDGRGGEASLRAIVYVMSLEAIEVVAIGPLELNRQSGLFEQPIRIINHHRHRIEGFTLVVRDLPNGVRAHNANELLEDGALAIRYSTTIGSVESGDNQVELLIEFLQPTLTAFPEPTYLIEGIIIHPGEQEEAASDGIPPPRIVPLRSGEVMIEFNTIIGNRYAIEYSHDAVNWIRVTPSITANAAISQWIDNGPPKTQWHPRHATQRFYRIVPLEN